MNDDEGRLLVHVKNNFFLIWLIFLFVYSIVDAQEDFNHPELEWETIETRHFFVHYHQGTQRTAQEVAKIAESVYGPITTMYDHEPDQRVSIIIRDHDDYSNGGAYFYDNKIELWASALDFELRGTHPWLWDVVTHEFTHIIQIQTTMKFGRKVPGIYFQWLGYEAERRPDVLYGYPNVIVSYPMSGFIVPGWFAEGVAQYNNPDFQYDYWDSHRDMILRMYMIDGNPLTWDEMAVFGKNSLGNESVYNSGFSLVSYIGQKYSVEKLREISRKLAAPFRLTMSGAIEAVLGKTGSQLYEEWKAEKTAQYNHLADSLRVTQREGEIIEKEGFGNTYPVFSQDNSKIAYISNKGEDNFAYSRVYLYDCVTKTSKLIVPEGQLPAVRSSLSFSPDGKYLYFARSTRNNPHWSEYNDLYRFNFVAKKEERLTYGLRAFNPKLSPDGKKIVYTTGSDGTLNLGICNADGKNSTVLTKFQNGEQVYTPVWSKDGKIIAFGYSIGHNQSIVIVDTNGENLRMLQHDGDCRDPFFASDSMLYYAWDRSGIFNIYALNLQTAYEQQVTNVLGGAFLPTLNERGDLAYVTYTSSGYKISLMKRDSIQHIMSSQESHLIASLHLPGSNSVSALEPKEYSTSTVNFVSPVDTGDSLQSKSYKSVFTSLSLYPLIRFDSYSESSNILDIIKPGLLVSSSDVVDKMDLFGGGAINRKYERDLFLIINYKYRLPILYQLGLEPIATLELYNITRKRSFSFDLWVNYLQTFNVDVTYNLFEFDFSLHQRIFSENCDLKFMYTLDKYIQDIGSWLHPDPSIGVVKATGSTYLISNILSVQYKYNAIHRDIDENINPKGRTFSLKYFYDISQFNPTDSAKYDNGFRMPIYTVYDMNRLEFNWSEHVKLPFRKQTLTFNVTANGIIGKTVDQFFDYYTGGLIGMRGYPFYAIGGNTTLSLNATYRFPIATSIDLQLLQFYFKKLYGSLFCDYGDGWSGQVSPIKNWKRDVGFELRFESVSFYSYPTSIFFSGAYGLDMFNRNFYNGINIQTISYGHEWRFYLGILFNFELNEFGQKRMMR